MLKHILAEIPLAKLALTHSSVTKDDVQADNNERLEFYGDSVLKLVFSKYLFERFTNEAEGKLTKYRARLISDDLLATIAKDIEMQKHIYVGSTLVKAKKEGKLPRSILGDALEALIGAIYIEQGYQKAEVFIISLWTPFIEQALEQALEEDYKSILQEKIQAEHNQAPTYKTLDEIGPAHQREFVVGVYFGDRLLAQAKGSSKKAAGQEAAKLALAS